MARSHEDLTQWQSDSWDDLRVVWRELMEGPPDGPSRFHEEEITARQAGYVFQTWIVEAFRVSGADVEPPFSVRSPDTATVTEEIDGLVFDGWKSFLLECKFRPGRPVSFGSIARFRLLVERRPVDTMGLFFAPFGFTPAASASVRELKPIKVLLFERSDIEYALTRGDLAETVRVKWKQAVKHGHPNWRLSEEFFQ